MPTKKTFDQLLIFGNLYQHAKNQFIPSDHSSDIVLIACLATSILTMPTPKIVHLEILQSDWLRGFWPISQEQDFSKRLCAGTQQIKIFSIEKIQ